MSGWLTARLEDCTEIVSGATPSTSESAYWDGDICWATPKDLSELDGAYISDTSRKITQSGLQSCAATVLPPESVLFSSRAPIGHVAINTVPMATNQGFKSFVPHRDRVHAKFLYHWLRWNRAFLESLGNGATFKEVSKAVVARIEVPLPPLPEQRRIAEILDKVNALRTNRRAALAQLDTLTQSIFLGMFGDPATNPKGWPTRRLDAVCSLVNGRAFKPDEWEEEGLPIIRIQNLNDTAKPFNYTTQSLPERFRVRPGDILFSWSGTPGTSFGCFRWSGPEGWLNQHIFNVRLNGALEGDYFIAHVNLKLVELIAKAHGGVGLQHVTKGMVDETMLMSPPAHHQVEFSRRVAGVEALMTDQRASLRGLDSLFASLQSRAFQGKLAQDEVSEVSA